MDPTTAPLPTPLPTPPVTPTLAPDQFNLDVWALIHQGALTTYPLIIASVIVFAITLERLWSLRGIIRSTAKLTATVVPLVARGDWAAAREAVTKHQQCPARRVFGDLLDTGDAPVPELERVAEERQFEETQGAQSYLWVLGTIGSAAPFIGLFGTVMGIIRAFHSMAIAGTGGFGVVASGISEALIATALGLAVGIVAVVLFNYFTSKVERIDAALKIGSARVLEAVTAARRVHGA
jgi:biopolymer transport protein ExbB